MCVYCNLKLVLYIILVRCNTMVRVHNNVEQNAVVKIFKPKPKYINYLHSFIGYWHKSQCKGELIICLEIVCVKSFKF